MNANREMAYYIGIDMGTGSVGMAITDENYNFDTYNSLTPNWYYKVLR